MDQGYMNTPNELEAHLYKTGTAALEMQNIQPGEAVRLCISALQAAEIPDAPRSLKSQIGRVRLILSDLYIQLTRYDKALENALEANGIYEEIEVDSGAARSLNAIGLANIHLGTYANALDNLLQALTSANELNDPRLKTQVLNHLGLLYLRMEEYAEALNYLEQGLAIGQASKALEADPGLLENISEAYMQLGSYDQALSYGQQCIQQYQSGQDHFGEAKATSMAGMILLAMGRPDEAIAYYQNALEICTAINYVSGKAQANYLIGELALQQNIPEKAEHHLLQALSQAKSGGQEKQVYETHRLLSQVYQALGNYQEALRHYKAFHETKEAVFNEDIATKIKSLEIIHRVRETQQDREIYRLANVELIQEIEERARVQDELERLTTMDPLTELYNRRHFFELTQNEMERCHRYFRPVSIIMLDIDDFKKVNDQFGHLVGDRVLVETARRIKKALRRVDKACRYGGEEFAILLPETNKIQAEMVAERLHQLIWRQPVIESDMNISITVSVGVASYDSEGILSVDTLLDRADQAMYQAKQGGRNQVVVYSPGQTED